MVKQPRSGSSAAPFRHPEARHAPRSLHEHPSSTKAKFHAGLRWERDGEFKVPTRRWRCRRWSMGLKHRPIPFPVVCGARCTQAKPEKWSFVLPRAMNRALSLPLSGTACIPPRATYATRNQPYAAYPCGGAAPRGEAFQFFSTSISPCQIPLWARDSQRRVVFPFNSQASRALSARGGVFSWHRILSVAELNYLWK